ncbi:hypothetical protein G6M84_20930 [Agrobacterium tumefaciens]|uniref:hypothetical protein n=1 Tax=Agrobacterium tumefaciens TaxID=358 RepID=UPI001574AC9F|nr:hypothetical protein [Agrobacterium tumefaciens]NTB98951.1 hypothetical protein [Agrobacterium tumefaciens]NTC45524.1 hypothetical protein [Agrobacterium tumefaciens]
MSAIRPLPLMPDYGGLIRTIALALPASFFAENRAADTVSPLIPIGNLLSALPADITAVIVTDRASLGSARAWLGSLPASCSTELIPLAGNDSVSHPWIQDMFHVRAVDPTTEFVLVAEKAIGVSLAEYLGAATTHSDVALAGGNQLVGADFRLVGYSSLQDDRGIGRDAAIPSQRWRKIQALDGRSIFSFGYRPEDLGKVPASADFSATETCGAEIAGKKMHQCGFHVDQFVSVTGLRSSDRPLLLVADPVAHGGCNARAATELKRKLDASALWLARQGFAVERNPIPLSPTIDTNKCLPRLYNNVLLENVIRSGQKRPFVWIPHFGDTESLEEFDAMNRKIWDRIGFQAIGVAGWSHLSSRNGALRCATKIINRGPDTRL